MTYTLFVIARSEISRLRIGTGSAISTPTCRCEAQYVPKQSQWGALGLPRPDCIGTRNDKKEGCLYEERDFLLALGTGSAISTPTCRCEAQHVPKQSQWGREEILSSTPQQKMDGLRNLGFRVGRRRDSGV